MPFGSTQRKARLSDLLEAERYGENLKAEKGDFVAVRKQDYSLHKSRQGAYASAKGDA